MKNLMRSFRELLNYPSAMIGLVTILLLVAVAVYALVSIPYDTAVYKWRGGEDVWYQNPRQAPPAWLNFFTAKKRPVSFTMNAADEDVTQTVETDAQGGREVTTTYTFDFTYDDFPQEMALYFRSKYETKQPYASVVWIRPDGREIRVTNLGVAPKLTYRFSQDEKLLRILRAETAMQGLYADLDAQKPTPLKGTYQLVVTTFTFEPDSVVDAELVLYGQLYGLAGTDHMRRDLMVAILWGTPIALAFGLLAAMGTTLTTMIIAAIGTWFGGWLDELIQRITEINLVLPFLPILLMIGTFYSRSIWLILGASILLNIFGAGIKTYRAVFMQILEAPYIEAARSYGAGDLRIVFQYMTPRIIPLLIPQLVILIPSYVFLEASLAVLGLGDPVLPTWGKVIQEAWVNGALYEGLYYWVLEPSFLLVVTGMAFALLGFALDRVFNPRLRGM